MIDIGYQLLCNRFVGAARLGWGEVVCGFVVLFIHPSFFLHALSASATNRPLTKSTNVFVPWLNICKELVSPVNIVNVAFLDGVYEYDSADSQIGRISDVT